MANRQRVLRAAFAASLTLHLAVLVLLSRTVERAPAEPASVAIELVPPSPKEVAKPEEPRPILARRQAAETPSPQSAAPQGEADAGEPTVPVQASAGRLDAPPSHGLNLRPGCRWRLTLTAGERRTMSPQALKDCENEQMVAVKDAWERIETAFAQAPPVARRDQTPYLARPPKNGCKPKASPGAGMGAGNDPPVLGVGCAFAF